MVNQNQAMENVLSHRSCVTNSCLWSGERGSENLRLRVRELLHKQHNTFKFVNPSLYPNTGFSWILRSTEEESELGETESKVTCSTNPAPLGWDPTCPLKHTIFSCLFNPEQTTTCWEGHWGEGKNELQTGLATDTGLTLGLLKEITERKIKNSNMWARQIWQLHHIILWWKSSYICAGPSPASGMFWIPENSGLFSVCHQEGASLCANTGFLTVTYILLFFKGQVSICCSLHIIYQAGKMDFHVENC